MSATHKSLVFIGIGSNLGNKLYNISHALRRLSLFGNVIECSSVYVSKPLLAHDNQQDYLNIVAALEVDVTPKYMLQCIRRIERSMGRPVKYGKWSSRIIDLDIILWKGYQTRGAFLTIPHPHYRDREFVTVPLSDLSEKLSDPGYIMKSDPRDMRKIINKIPLRRAVNYAETNRIAKKDSVS